MKITGILSSVVLFASIFLVSGCNRKTEIVFDEREPLALAPDVSWAVVVNPYAAYQSAPGWSSAVSGHARKGDVIQVLGKSLAVTDEVWYRFPLGWLNDSCLTVYSNRFKALSAVEQMGKE